MAPPRIRQVGLPSDLGPARCDPKAATPPEPRRRTPKPRGQRWRAVLVPASGTAVAGQRLGLALTAKGWAGSRASGAETEYCIILRGGQEPPDAQPNGNVGPVSRGVGCRASVWTAVTEQSAVTALRWDGRRDLRTTGPPCAVRNRRLPPKPVAALQNLAVRGGVLSSVIVRGCYPLRAFRMLRGDWRKSSTRQTTTIRSPSIR